MIDIRPMIREYKMNTPLHMLESKYSIPIHKIIDILYSLMLKQRRRNEFSKIK